MSGVPAPFKGPIVQYEDVMSRRYAGGVEQGLLRSVFEVLNAPEYEQFAEQTCTARNCERCYPDLKRGRGRPAGCARLILVAMVVSLVFCEDARSGRNRVCSTPKLRERLGLSALTAEREVELANMLEGDVRDPDVPSESACRDFVRTWTKERFLEFLPLVHHTALNVVADAVHRHDLSCTWVATDGKRSLASTHSNNGPGADEGTAVFTRGNGEESFNQRHIFPVALVHAPFVLQVLVRPPDAELTTLVEEGVPALKDASDYLAETITEMRIRDGGASAAAQHHGLRRAAVASDGVLANPRGVQVLLDNGFYPATAAPQCEPEVLDSPRTIDTRDGLVSFELRSDGALLCPACKPEGAAVAQVPMEVLAGEFGKNVRVRCGNVLCSRSGRSYKVSLRGRDRNNHLPASTVSRGEWDPNAIAMLPVWSDEYIARRFLALQRVEWVHTRFETLYGLGTKNKGFERRMLNGTHANQVWWALASLAWNIMVRHNLDDGRSQLVELRPAADLARQDIRASAARDDAPTIEKTVAAYWRKHREIEKKKEQKKASREERAVDQVRRLLKRNDVEAILERIAA